MLVVVITGFFKTSSGTKIWLTFSISLEPKCKTQESGQNTSRHSRISNNANLGPGSTVERKGKAFKEKTANEASRPLAMIIQCF